MELEHTMLEGFFGNFFGIVSSKIDLDRLHQDDLYTTRTPREYKMKIHKGKKNL